ncbi:MAG TPA: EmrB/QacA family drug resistance transporter, partial [Stellaceae bacterium]|nr:EmrB/QacA family drug resistance transporter [Stellaceae bacterium]
ARNAGSSVGVSVVSSVLVYNTQVVHAALSEYVTPFNPMLRAPFMPSMWDMHSPFGMAALNYEITRQASMVAYVNDFTMMMVITLAAVPLLALMRNPRKLPGGVPLAEEAVALD